MNIVVLGHLVLDEIHPHRGPVIESLGGIYFPVAAFGALAAERDIVRPCVPVGADAWDSILKAAAAFPRIDRSHFRRTADPNTRVRLFHDEKSEYNTQLVRSLPPIPPELFLHALPDADLVYVNFMTGEDMTIDSAEMIRQATRGLIYLDLHMIAYRVGADGHRFPHRVSAWERWASFPDVMQCNERELAALIPGEEDEAGRAAGLPGSGGLRMLVVTKGARGATVYSTDGRFDILPLGIERIVDSTGCGDIFGSTFAYFLAAGVPTEAAGAKAAVAGAFAAGIPGSHGMERLPEFIDRGSA